MKRIIGSLIVALAILLPAQTSSALGEAHAITGIAQLSDGRWLQIEAQPVWPYLVGKAWLMEAATSQTHVLEIELDCLHVTWYGSAYPFPPYTPYRVAMATGRGADGVRYYITAVDMAPDPLGFGDRLLVTTERGDSSCAAHDALGERVATGDIVIT